MIKGGQTMAANISENNSTNNDVQNFIETNALSPNGPAKELFIAGVSVFEITIFTPPVQRVTILAINLPEPDTFGPYDSYTATLSTPGSDVPLSTLYLVPTEDKQNWVANTLLDFGGTIPDIEVSVRPTSYDRMGEVILRGSVFP